MVRHDVALFLSVSSSPSQSRVFHDTLDSFVDPRGRRHIHRVLVRAVVPVFVSQGITTKKARSFLIGVLAEALRQGRFLKASDLA